MKISQNSWVKLRTFVLLSFFISFLVFLVYVVISIGAFDENELFSFDIRRTVNSVQEIDYNSDSLSLFTERHVVLRSAYREFDSAAAYVFIPFNIDYDEYFQEWALGKGFTEKDESGTILRIEPDSHLLSFYYISELNYDWSGKLYPYSFWQIADSLQKEMNYRETNPSLLFKFEEKIITEEFHPVRIESKVAYLKFSFIVKEPQPNIVNWILTFTASVVSTVLVLLTLIGFRRLLIYVRKKIKSVSRKNALITLGVVILYLALTNPSLKDFEEHGHTSVAMRKYNFLLFSIYQDEVAISRTAGSSSFSYEMTYLGISKNFIRLD